MPWTATELRAMKAADEVIEETFETCEAYSREQMLLDRWLDRIALKQQSCLKKKQRSYGTSDHLSQKAARIAYQRRYRQKNKEVIALKKRVARRTKRRKKHEESQ